MFFSLLILSIGFIVLAVTIRSAQRRRERRLDRLLKLRPRDGQRIRAHAHYNQTELRDGH